MRRIALSGASAVLLAGPTVLAFFTGGYFASARTWAGVGAWVLVAAGLVLRPDALRLGRWAWVTISGLALLAGWTLLSIIWAPIAGNAYGAGQIAVVYLGVLLAAVALLRERSVQRLVDPALAGGALIVVGYGMSARLLPGVLHFARSSSALGRLEQPLTYWNAMGELAAIGLVLATRIAGDASRQAWLRIVAVAGSAMLGLGLYVTFSRGALFACVAGLITLLVVARTREQLWAVVVCALTAALGALAGSQFNGVTSLEGTLSAHERQGAITLGLLVVVMLLGAAVHWRWLRRETPTPLRLPRRASLAAVTVIGAGLALAIVLGANETGTGAQTLSGGASRLTTLQSNRYDYWNVALRAFSHAPVIGVGAGGWSVWWLRYRTVNEFASDAHSLPLQVLAELGVIGLALLAAFLAGLTVTSARALRAGAVAVGPVAGFVTYIAHAPLDWDWQMPAVTLVAMVMAGALLAIGSPTLAPRPAPARERAISSVGA